MRCFQHEEREAVGTCKSCGKGICRTCAVDLGKGLACSGRCEADVRDLISLIDRNVRLSPSYEHTLGANRQGWLLSGVFLIVCGTVFLAASAVTEHGPPFAWVLGGAFVLFGLLQFLRYRRLMSSRA
jgi:hypothetical protein